MYSEFIKRFSTIIIRETIIISALNKSQTGKPGLNINFLNIVGIFYERNAEI